MRPLGTVRAIVGGQLVVRADADTEPPETGNAVVDESLTELGTVAAVFGPVEQPYLVVTPAGARPDPGAVGDRAYAR